MNGCIAFPIVARLWQQLAVTFAAAVLACVPPSPPGSSLVNFAARRKFK